MQYRYNQEEKKKNFWQLYGLHALALLLGAFSILGSCADIFGLHETSGLCCCLGCQGILEELLGIIGGLVPLVTAIFLERTARRGAAESRQSQGGRGHDGCAQHDSACVQSLPAGKENIRVVAVQWVDPRAWYVDAAWEPAGE